LEPEWEPGGEVICKVCRAGACSTGGAGVLVGWEMLLSHAKLMPSPKGQGSWQGIAPVIPCGAGAQESLGGGLVRWGSWQGVSPVWSKRQGSQQGVDAVIPHRAGAQQSLRGRGSSGEGPGRVWIRHSPRGGEPSRAWIWYGARAWHGLRSGYPDGCGAWIQRGPVARQSLRGGEPGERCCVSAHLWGRDLAGQLFFY
jgi:hypothetical protein